MKKLSLESLMVVLAEAEAAGFTTKGLNVHLPVHGESTIVGWLAVSLADAVAALERIGYVTTDEYTSLGLPRRGLCRDDVRFVVRVSPRRGLRFSLETRSN